MTRVVRHVTRRPFLTIAVSLGLAALGLWYAARALTFQTSAVELLPPDRVYVERFKRYLRDFGELNDIVIAIGAPQMEQAKAFATRLADDLRRPPLHAQRVSYRIDPDAFAGRTLLYASTGQLTELRDKVTEHRAFLEAYAANPTLAQLVDGVNLEIARRFAGHFVDLGLDEPVRLDSGFIDALLAAIAERLQRHESGSSPWGSVFTSERVEESGYFLSRDKKLLFMLVEPRREAGNFTDNQGVIAGIRGRIAALRAEYPAVEAGVTGTPALSNDEMLTAFHDTEVATVLASVLTLLSVLVLFRRVVRPVLMFLVLMVSLAWSMGLITLTVGHLTVFSVMFISLFVGIGIDYGIYFLFRYEEEKTLGHSVPAALAITAGRAGPGILFAALSAAGTFGVLTLTEFRGIVEFGFIAGLAILMAFVAMVTLFPAVLVTLDRWTPRVAPPLPAAAPVARPAMHLLEWLTSYSRTILAAAAVAAVTSAWALTSVGFDYNRLNLQAKGTESAAWELKILASGRSAFPALASAATLEELKDKQEAFARLPTVSDVTSILNVVPDRQAEKIDIIRDLAGVVAPLRIGSPAPEDPRQLQAALTTLRQRLALAIREAGTDTEPTKLIAADQRAQALLEQLRDPRPETTRRLQEIQAEFSGDFATQLRRVQNNLAPRPITVADLPAEVTRKFVGASGAFLLQIYPSVNTWERSGVAQFVSELRSVDAAATGSPVISYEAGRMMERAYFEGTLYALVLVVALSAIMLRRWREGLLAVLPMILGTLWTVGLMRLMGLSFNLANVWALPLIIGASAEYGLNVALRHREAMLDGGPVLARSTVLAVLLNGLTTIAGFGSLLVARHQGIFGLGLLLTVGAVSGLVASLVVLPVLLRLLGQTERARTGAGARKPAMTLLVLVGLLLPLGAVGRAAAGAPTQQVETAVAELFRLVSAPGALDGKQRETAANEVMDRLFDWRTMARHSLRQYWDERTPAERDDFTQLFAEVFRKAYLARINLVDASKFRYLGDRITGDRATVDTQVTTKRGSTINVAYLTAKAGASDWRVEDVRVEGISLLDNYRTQFATIIGRSSYEALVKRLRDRLKERG